MEATCVACVERYPMSGLMSVKRRSATLAAGQPLPCRAMRRAFTFHGSNSAALGALVLCALGNAPLLSQSTRQQHPVSASASASALQCATKHATSVAVPFESVDLGNIAERTAQLENYRGPQVRTVVIDSTKWLEVWRATADTVPPPPVAFGSDALILLATRAYPFGPTSLSVKWIRKCRRSGVIVVASVQTGFFQLVHETYPSRGMALVRVPRGELESARIVFQEFHAK